ncbi:MAG: N-6 DNA methylase, partial [Chloroflexota bacterium]|nr:N-6 DNA methylase [Chloroflexota bacterium]
MPPQTAYDQIEERVKKFKALSKRERDAYNEADTRKDFILPLFRAMEWNIDDMREVAAEEKISRGFVDFSFRINGVRRFVLETKRIGEDLNDPRWAQQSIDYAYHKGVTWAVLSDFEGLKIFNAEAREQNPFQAQFKEFGVDDYLPRLDELWWLSRSAILEGVLDREAEKAFKKIIKTPITQALFDNLKDWRGKLYKLLREYNRGKLYDAKQIDDAVQRILDRLIFIRTAEDREVESEKLIALVRELKDRNRPNELIPALNLRFRELDRVYNSQLFAPHYSEDLDIGEPSTLADIISGLYGSPANFTSYNFALIDADVLGRVYEQYLGYVLSEHEELEAKKAKRKSQGIYYTPTFVVKYIVQQTLGRYLEERGYNAARTVRVLDPACGSGSFLIEAFDVLDQFLARESGQAHGAHDMHDYARHMQILTSNLYGVDKDEQAVEVAQLNLLLKALSVPSKLPKLENIRQGDSLISGTPKELDEYFGADWKKRNPFNWDEQFRAVMADGGFDVIVGNPPYVRIQTLPKDEVAFFNNHYAAATGNYDIYILFVERALQLLKPGGAFGMILPNKFMQVDYGAGLRKLISGNRFVDRIVDFKEFQVFEAATTYTCLLFLKKQANPKFTVIAVQKKDDEGTEQIFDAPIQELASDALAEKAWSLGGGTTNTLLEKIASNSTPLLELPS